MDHLLEGGCLSLPASMRLEVLAPSCYLAKPCACWEGLGEEKGKKNLSLHSAVGCHDPCILVTSPGAGTRPHLGIFFVPSASYSSAFLASLRGKGGDCIAFFHCIRLSLRFVTAAAHRLPPSVW